MTIKNIKDLKELIANLPDDMEIGGSGHYGEFLEIYDIQVKTVKSHEFPRRLESVSMEILCISMESAGDEPE